MGFLDGLKMPDMADLGKKIMAFIGAADQKLDAQTAAIRMLAEQVRKQNEEILRLATKFDEWQLSGGGAACIADFSDERADRVGANPSTEPDGRTASGGAGIETDGGDIAA